MLTLLKTALQRHKLCLPVLFVVYILTACAVKNTPNSQTVRSTVSSPTVRSTEPLPDADPAEAAALVEQYIALLQQNDTAGAKALTCYPTHFSQSPLSNLTVNSSEIMDVHTGVRSLQDSSVGYTRVDVRINQTSRGRILSVWNPNDHYKASQSEDAEWRAIGGEPRFGGERTNWSQATKCIDDSDMHVNPKQITTGLSKPEIETIMRGSLGQQVEEDVYVWKDPTSRTARQVSFQEEKSSRIRTVSY